MRRVRAEACVRAGARSCVCVRAPASAPTRASTSRRRRVSSSRLAGVFLGVGLQREHRRVEHRLRHDVVPGMRRFRPGAHRGGLRSVGRRRMRGRCARCRCAHVAMCMRVYVDGSPLDTHLCSSAIELPLHLSLLMSNAHMHRPFPRCMYMYPFARLHRAHGRVCAWVWCVYGGVLHACKLRVSIDIQTFYQASTFNANIGAWNTARVTDSYSVCAASGPARTAADCARPVAGACVRACGRVLVCVRARASVCACARPHPRRRV
jgi:hypothetical protein